MRLSRKVWAAWAWGNVRDCSAIAVKLAASSRGHCAALHCNDYLGEGAPQHHRSPPSVPRFGAVPYCLLGTFQASILVPASTWQATLPRRQQCLGASSHRSSESLTEDLHLTYFWGGETYTPHSQGPLVHFSTIIAACPMASGWGLRTNIHA
jgi:hypothetical protein